MYFCKNCTVTKLIYQLDSFCLEKRNLRETDHNNSDATYKAKIAQPFCKFFKLLIRENGKNQFQKTKDDLNFYHNVTKFFMKMFEVLKHFCISELDIKSMGHWISNNNILVKYYGDTLLWKIVLLVISPMGKNRWWKNI